jgi:hypothetical protein
MTSRLLPNHRFLAFAATSCLLACNTGGNDGLELEGSSTDPSTTAAVTTNQDSTSSNETSDSDSDTTTTTTGPLLDIGGSETMNTTASDEGDPDGCKKVDFLFIIDNSGSMLEEQDALIASFDGFIGAIDTTIQAEQDYHIMVTDTDEWVWSGCPMLCNFFPPPMTGTPGEPTSGCVANPEFNCGNYCLSDADCAGMGNETCVNSRCSGTMTQPMQCENILGAGVTYPRGSNASNVDCNFSTGARYMDSSEGIQLVGKFSCAAQVGDGSTEDPERPMEAMVQAVTEGTSAVATCNDGFLRDDAILVVTFITDEDDDAADGSSGSAAEWYDTLVQAKNGDPTAVVMLGIYGPGSCAESSARLDSFMDMWGDQGLKGDVCASNYESFFTEAVRLIDPTCDGFIPPD